MSTLPARVGITAITENILKRKWSLVILHYFERGTGDSAEILAAEPNLSAKVMSERLRAMLRYGLIARYPRPSPSAVIEYRLTPFGRKFLELMKAIERLDYHATDYRQNDGNGVCHVIDAIDTPSTEPALARDRDTKKFGQVPTFSTDKKNHSVL